jgi:cytochrome b
MITVQVWDLPLRLFHWLLALAVIGSIITGEIGGGLMDWHGRCGIFIVGLLVFRLVWGFIGATHARFHHFFPTPAKIKAYFNGEWHGHGHNPLGALAVFGLLGLLATLVSTGLFANDDIAFQAPLFSLVDKALSDKLTAWHALSFNILAGLIILHLIAIAFYTRVKKHNLLKPMITGKKQIPRHHAIPFSTVGVRRFVVALIISGGVVWGVSGGLSYFSPPPQPAAASSNW